MSIYLGQSGLIDLRRISDGASFDVELNSNSITSTDAGTGSNSTRRITIWAAPETTLATNTGAADDIKKSAIMGKIKDGDSYASDWTEYIQLTQLSTGDLITIESVDTPNKKPLAFVKGRCTANCSSSSPTYEAVTDNKFSCYVYVDEMGGVRLYDSTTSQKGFQKALDGNRSEALELVAIPTGTTYKLRISIDSGRYRPLGQVTSYELNTNREVIDVTSLSDQFRQQYSALMTGSGRITCIWDYKSLSVAAHFGRTSDVDYNYQETPRYLNELLVRANIGSAFMGLFYLKTASGASGSADDTVWYRVKGILTNVAMSFDVGEIIKMTAEFVTTGPFFIQSATETEYILLQQDGFDILATDEDKIISSKDTA